MNSEINGQTISVKKPRNSSGDEIANVNFLYDDIVGRGGYTH